MSGWFAAAEAVALRIDESAKGREENPNSLRSDMRIFFPNTDLSILSATTPPVDANQTGQYASPRSKSSATANRTGQYASPRSKSSATANRTGQYASPESKASVDANQTGKYAIPRSMTSLHFYK